MSRSLIALILLACMTSAEARVLSDQVEPILQYLSLTAPSANVQATDDPKVAKIIIKPSAITLVSLTPIQFTRNVPISAWDRTLWSGVFEADEIPAVLTWSDKGQSESGVLLNLRLSHLNEKTGLVILTGTLGDAGSPMAKDNLSFLNQPVVLGNLKNASLTLGDTQGRILRSVNAGFLKEREDQAIRPTLSNGPLSPPSVCLLQPFTQCQKMSMRGVDLSGLDLTGSDFSDTDLSAAKLVGTRLVRANLYAADLTFADLELARMNGANLSYADLSFANLKGAVWPLAKFGGAILHRVNTDTSALGQTDFPGSKP